MSYYKPVLVTGDYSTRQRRANDINALAYFEQHFNASTQRTANYTCAIVGKNASLTSKQWASLYCELVSDALGTVNKGVIVGGFNGRGSGNLESTRMPAILAEPCFITTQAGYDAARFMADTLAKCIARSIYEIFAESGNVALSIGHIGKTSAPNDKGAKGIGGLMEGELAKTVVYKSISLIRELPGRLLNLSGEPE